MFFKLTMYVNKSYNYSGGMTNPNNVNGLDKMNAGLHTIYVSTDEIKRIGHNDTMYQVFIEFKTPPVPFSSQTMFVWDNGSTEFNSIRDMISYIDGTERF